MISTMLRAVGGMVLVWTAALTMPLQAQQTGPDFDALVHQQRAALERFAWMDGVWRGTVSTTGPEGAIELVQTERVGTYAGGTMRVIEGRGYAGNGALLFNAAATITYDPAAGEFVMTSTARGMTARPRFTTTADGFEWSLKVGPALITYVARHKDGVWTEEGFMAMDGQPKRQFLTMRLERVSDTDWPNAGAVGPK